RQAPDEHESSGRTHTDDLRDRRVSATATPGPASAPRRAKGRHVGDSPRAALLDRSRKRPARRRSEEHTSELQSRENLVCRLLLATPISYTYTLSLHDALPISARPPTSTSPADARTPTIFVTAESPPPQPRGRRRHLGAQRGGTSAIRHAPPSSTGLGSVPRGEDRKSTRLNSSHVKISYAVFCLQRPSPTPTLSPYTTLFRSPPGPRRARVQRTHAHRRSS